MARKLTPLQLAALGRVCRTNGGGVSVLAYHGPDDSIVISDRVMNALYKRGLIQGKAGSYSTVVHTREGLALWRESQVQP